MTERKPSDIRALRAAFVAGARWGNFLNAPEVLREEEAARLYPYATKVVYTVAEDPHNRGWYWRVKDGHLEVNFFSDEMDERFWESYDIAHTPGLAPTAERCDVWAKLFSMPSIEVVVDD